MRISPAPVRLLRHLSRFSLAVLVLLLAASCHSTQVAYLFRPAPSYATTNPVTTVIPDSVMVSAPVAAAPVAAPAIASKPAQAVTQPSRQMRQLRRVVAHKLGQQLTKATASRSAAQRAHQVARPHEAAEVGLGTTVFGVLGLIVLPISLIGLLIWGGPVWAILAGLSALAILIAYLDPFG